MKLMPEKLLVLAAILMLLFASTTTATITVRQNERIQTAIDAAKAGETIEVHGSIFQESLVINKQLTVRGISTEKSLPRVETDNGPAITLKANGIILENLWAKSASGWNGDAGILILSSNNIVRNNMASGNGNAGILMQKCTNNTITGNAVQGNGNEGVLLKDCSNNLLQSNQVSNNKYGIKLTGCRGNRILYNTINENRNEAIYLQNSQTNLIDLNHAARNYCALTLDTCRDNTVRRNQFMGNSKGISVSYLDTSQDKKSSGKGVVISYNSMPSADSISTNNTIYDNTLYNEKNAYDNSQDNWDNGLLGNNYSDFNDPEEGCSGTKICNFEHSIPGGPSVDRFAQAAPKKIPGQATGEGGAVLQLFGSSFVPGGKMTASYFAPVNQEVWLGIENGEHLQGDRYLGKNLSGKAEFDAPQGPGSYRLMMHDRNGTTVMFLPFRVAVPELSATPSQAYICQRIYVAFQGASGQKSDWIGMYRAGTSELLIRQNLGSMESGNITFSHPDTGLVEFKLFASDAAEPAATSNSVELRANAGHKVIAEPSRVAPGGTVVVTFWGAPLQGTGVIGMYGMTRPDKFDLGKKPIGARSCGSMVWQLPYQPGQYDFRMFQDDINRPLLAQSNVVTVG